MGFPAVHPRRREARSYPRLQGGEAMLALIGRRLLVTLPLLLFVTLLVNLMRLLVPGDPAVQIAGENATHEQIELTRQRLGLDRPWHERYLDWLAGAARGEDRKRTRLNYSHVKITYAVFS